MSRIIYVGMRASVCTTVRHGFLIIPLLLLQPAPLLPLYLPHTLTLSQTSTSILPLHNLYITTPTLTRFLAHSIYLNAYGT